MPRVRNVIASGVKAVIASCEAITDKLTKGGGSKSMHQRHRKEKKKQRNTTQTENKTLVLQNTQHFTLG